MRWFELVLGQDATSICFQELEARGTVSKADYEISTKSMQQTNEIKNKIRHLLM